MTLDILINHLPPMYYDASNLRDLYNAIVPELDRIKSYLVTQNSQSDDELDLYLDNKIGYGYKRFINQQSVTSVNDALDYYTTLYNLESYLITKDDFISLRNILLFLAKINYDSNYISLVDELTNLVDFFNIVEDYSKYIVYIYINLVNSDNFNFIINRMRKIVPCHLNVLLYFNFLTIDGGHTIDDMLDIDNQGFVKLFI